VIGIDPRYRNMTCYNCREPGHFVGICSKPKICFMCVVPRHYMTECPKWKKAHPVATYLGSAGSGLGFYHIELPEVATTRWLNINNCGVVMIKLSALGIGLGTVAETRNDASKTTSKIDDKNQIKKQFISSQIFHRTYGGRIRKTTVGVQFGPRIFESFEPATQE
jgi:hypothetical protein